MLKFLYIFCALFPILRTWTAKPRNTTKSCQIPDDQETFADSDRLLTESSKKLAISWKGGFHDSISTQENASTDRFHSFHCPLRSQDKPGWEQRASVVLHGWRMVKENIYSKQAACPCLMPGSRGQFSCQSSVPSLAFRIPCKKKVQAKKRYERKSHPSKNVRAFAGDHCKARSEASQSTRQAILNFGYGAVRSSETFPMSACWLSYDDLSCRVTCSLCISCARFYHRILPPGWASAMLHPLQI